ncbi:hypothetical protein FRC15_006719 [Serendipita sp. 397]|nr:hypothetical protein FRC15_006719 [Serendipita sp. 397]
MPLTMNRTDHSGLTTSMEDIFLVPLPCWIFLVYTIMLFLTAVHGGHEKGKPMMERELPNPPSRLRRIIVHICTAGVIFFTFGAIVLSALEVARLAQIHYGFGLLPFVPVTEFLAAVLFMIRNKPPKPYRYKSKFGGSFRARVGARVYPFWVLMIIVLSVKLSTLIRLPKVPERESGPYAIHHQINDVALSIGCLVIVFFSGLFGMALDIPTFT